jgi:hypothetical protein
VGSGWNAVVGFTTRPLAPHETIQGLSSSVPQIQAESQEVLKTLTLEVFQGCMESWKKSWDRCIHAQGDYFKGDGAK